MKAAVVKSNSNIEIKNIENPPIGPGDMLVQMRACGICGSDVEKVFGKYGQPSMRLGHEPAGVITQVGSEISNFSIGDRVFTHHHVACYSDDCHECSHENEKMCKKYYESNLVPCGLADEYVVPEWNVKHGGVLNIPDNMSFEEAAMIEPLACCIRAWNKFTHKNNDSIAILGIGPTGIMHALLAELYGFRKIFCLDLNEFRLDFAKKFGKNGWINTVGPNTRKGKTSFGLRVNLIQDLMEHARGLIIASSLKGITKGIFKNTPSFKFHPGKTKLTARPHGSRVDLRYFLHIVSLP